MPKIPFNPSRNADEILDRKGLAKALKVHIGTINRLMDEGMPYFKIGARPRFYYPDIIQWIRVNRTISDDHQP